jgi:hypothetical protein
LPVLGPQDRQALLGLFPDGADGTGGPAGEALDPLPALERLLSQLAADPLVLVFEDLHWADDVSAELLRRLAATAHRHPLLLVVTARPEAQPAWPAIPVLSLAPLTPAESERLVVQAWGSRPPPAEVREAIARHSDGIPLFAEELVRTWSPGSDAGQQWLPASLAELTTSRLDGAGGARRTAQLAAVVGRGFTAELVAALDGRETAAVEADLEALQEVDLIQERRTGRGAHFHLKHSLVEEGIYASLPAGERTVLHGRLADLLVERFPTEVAARPDWLARHLERAGRGLEAARSLLQAAGQSAHLGAHHQTLEHLRRARHLLRAEPDSAERDELAGRVERFYRTQGLFTLGFRQSGEAQDASAATAGGDDFATRFNALLQAVPEGRWQDLVEQARALLAVAEADGDTDEIRTARHTLGVCADFAGLWPLAEQHLTDVLPGGVEAAPAWLVHLYNGPPRAVELGYRATVALFRCRSEEARWADREALAEARRYGSPNLTGYVLAVSAAYNRHARQPDAVLERAREMAALGREEGLRVPRLAGLAYREWAKAALGRGGNIRRVEAVARGEGDSHGQGILDGPVVHAYGLQGCWGQQEALCRELLGGGRAQTTEDAKGANTPEIMTYLGEGLLIRGGAEEGIAWLQQAVDLARDTGARRAHLRAAIPLARHWLEQGWVTEAESCLARALRDIPAGEDNPDLTEVRRLHRRCQQHAERE